MNNCEYNLIVILEESNEINEILNYLISEFSDREISVSVIQENVNLNKLYNETNDFIGSCEKFQIFRLSQFSIDPF